MIANLGRNGTYRDAMWDVTVGLSPLEEELLTSRPVRRLHFIAHAGAAALTTHQTYSRLEHSLGVLALAAHFAPDDAVVRAAAMLHDVGHLPFSHSFEGLAGLDHHALGTERIRGMSPVLARHGMDVEEVLAAESGRRPSVLHSPVGALKLDHLESLVRSGRAHGRLDVLPSALLARIRIVDGAVDTDRQTAALLTRLVEQEANYHCSWENTAPNAMLSALVERLLDMRPEALVDLCEWTDQELVQALLAHPATAYEARLLCWEPWRIHVREDGDRNPAEAGFPYVVDRLYLAVPRVDGLPARLDTTRLPKVPVAYRVAVEKPGESERRISAG